MYAFIIKKEIEIIFLSLGWRSDVVIRFQSCAVRLGVGSGNEEAAARSAVETAAKSVRDLRVAEVLREDVTIENGGIVSYRVRLGISFKFESGD